MIRKVGLYHCPLCCSLTLSMPAWESGEWIEATNVCGSCFSKRIDEIERRQRLPVGGQAFSQAFMTEMHVGFLCLVETEEELERLKNTKWASKDTTATSKISETGLKEIHPINRVAARVVK